MIDYTQIDELRLFYLEDSWVLGVTAWPGMLAFSIEFVLRPEHKDYQTPLPGERYSYRRGELRFEGVSNLHWIGQGLPPARDASGELDYGGVDSFELNDGFYRIRGDFGEVSVQADSLRIVLTPV
ncbi:hypothetical protein [Lentzea sp. NPDC051838]|uniref:hypothetical protein n=1 Tax=Lentzea sp. NPDC051838 TaxID=3154849 RepID=UPI00342F6300